MTTPLPQSDSEPVSTRQFEPNHLTDFAIGMIGTTVTSVAMIDVIGAKIEGKIDETTDAMTEEMIVGTIDTDKA